MDLTKKIEVAVEVIRFERTGVNVPAFIVRALSEPHINKPNTSISSAPFLLSRATEPYRRLFEEAPRTKLEHGKMLIALKDVASRDMKHPQPTFAYVPNGTMDFIHALIAEIEAPEGCVPDPTRRPHGEGHSIATTNIRPAPPLGDIEGAAG